MKMQVLDLFDKYFYIMMIVQSFTILTIDSKKFKKENNITNAKKAKILAISVFVISTILFIIKKMI